MRFTYVWDILETMLGIDDQQQLRQHRHEFEYVTGLDEHGFVNFYFNNEVVATLSSTMGEWRILFHQVWFTQLVAEETLIDIANVYYEKKK